MMLTTRVRRIFLARQKVDLRKAHSGLLAEAFKMGLDPYMGDLVIFVGRGRGSLKVLYADPTGLWCSVKQFTLEAMKTRFRFLDDPTATEITQAELAMIAEGAAYHIDKRVLPYNPKPHLEGYHNSLDNDRN